MTDDQQVIIKGSIVQSRKHGWQGIVTTVLDNLWASELHSDIIREYMGMQTPPITDEEATTQRWVRASDFAYMDFTAPESDLFTIPITKIRFSEFPSAFVAKILRTKQGEEGLLLQLESNQAQSGSRPTFLIINKPTVIPWANDSICGTQDVVIITADGLNYPYKRTDNKLTQDW